MYALVENNEITKLITNPKSLVIGDVRYPAKIFSVWSASELNAIGIYEVVTDSSNFCLLYTSPSPRDRTRSRMPSSA